MANTLEQRKKLIKARQERLARDAKKQGLTPEQLLKKKRDTYLGVVGGAALGALPFGAIARGATALFKGIGGAAKVSKVGKTVAIFISGNIILNHFKITSGNLFAP